MIRVLGVLMCFLLSVFYFFDTQNTFIVFASNVFDEVEVLVDKNDEKLIEVDASSVDNFIKIIGLKNYSKFALEDRVIIEGYSNKLKDYVVINNHKINIQISITDNLCLIGYPLIKNSF